MGLVVLVVVLRSRIFKLGLLLALLGLVLIVMPLRQQVLPALAARSEQKELKEQLHHIFTTRAQSLVNGNYEGLKAYYDTTVTSGLFALNHEIGRIKYVREWVKERQVIVSGSQMDLAIIDAGSEEGKGWASVSQHIILNYHHQGEPEKTINQMGVRTIHWVELVKRDGQWLIARDWYWDPFEADNLDPDITPGTARCSREVAPPPPGKYRRQAAVSYADRYSGVRLGPGDGRYNQAYRDFTGLGGDCANFVSQVLSDKNAGAIPRDWVWNYHNGNGSQAWVQAEALVHYLLDSGLAVRIMRGNFEEVTRTSTTYPQGAVNALQPGDIIAYEEKGEISHVSVVVGRDSAGYLLVNSHTADRARVPWDMGWDRRTIYWLLQVVY
ncbi:amidase domain-containing protein [Neomoorella mulderi]|uniref:Putative amidase domain protein n=1 Tax=Moorella mulderi DSM 14980 TaxID=1122241 RepID=A0A151AUC6_9FIRM|nr:amidase domain-containing protein [Moorella mulderi]KYH31256.1 putative amidase domain protein [Moorella mulderi DSM 14980]